LPLRESCKSFTAVELISTPISGDWLFGISPTVSPLPTGTWTHNLRPRINNVFFANRNHQRAKRAVAHVSPVP
jgi:hypothetical protein